MSESFGEKFARIEREGRPLVRNVEAKVFVIDPFLVASICTGTPLETAVAKVSAFAFVLSAIIAVLVFVGAAPKPIGGIAVMWLVTGIAARLYVRRRRREHGRFVVDFEASTIAGETVDGEPIALGLGGVRILPAVDEALPLSVCLEAAGRRLRFARTSEEDATKLLYFFRKYNVRISDARVKE